MKSSKNPTRRSSLTVAVLVAAIPALIAALSIGVAFGVSQDVKGSISDLCPQSNNAATPTSTPVSNTTAGDTCNLIFNGFGSNWHYYGAANPTGLRIDSEDKAIQAYGKPTKNGSVIEANSFGDGVVISATNQLGGRAFFFNGGGLIQGNNNQNPILQVENAGKASALQVVGQASAYYSQTQASALWGTNPANSFDATGTRGSAAYGSGVQGDSHFGVGVYANTYNNNYPALFAANGGADAQGYTYKDGGPAFEFDGNGKIKGNVDIQGNLVSSNFAINDDSEALEQGDLVVLSGSSDINVGPGGVAGVPTFKVKKARNTGDPNVIGVVERGYGQPSAVPQPFNEAEPPQPIAPGSTLLVATLGSYKVLKVDTSNGAIVPGTLLVSSGANPGYAAKAKLVEVSGQQLAPVGVIGKALTPLSSAKGTVAVLLTQH
jgi:hypothetical protein